MNTFLYVLVSGTEDRYADMTAASAAFLRDVHPDGRIVILCDTSTAESLRAVGHPLLRLTDEMVTRDVPQGNAQSKILHLKSRMRGCVAGDFISLDSNTVVVRPLDRVFRTPEPVALAHNRNSRYPENLTVQERLHYKECGWPLPGNGHYLDTGVVYWRDCPEAHEFCAAYRETVDSIHARGLVTMDRPAFNRALEVWGGDFGILPDRFNAQVYASPVAGIDASVWNHAGSKRPRDGRAHFDEALRRMSEGLLLDGGFIGRVRSSRIHISTPDGSEEERLIALMRAKGSLDRRDLPESPERRPTPSCPRTFCTIITADYLPYALNLHRSIREHDSEIHFNILVSNRTLKDFRPELPDDVTFVHFPEDVNAEGIGARIMEKYRETDSDAYRWSNKPVFINHLIREMGYTKVAYVDCDICFFNGFGFLFDLLDANRVLLTPHWRTPHPSSDPEEYRLLFSHGLYNAGFIAASDKGTEVMDWWAENCLYSCRKGSFPGEYVDQSIMNLMPLYFEGVHVLGHKGCNVSVWNQHVCRRTWNEEREVVINDEFPVVFVHFVSNVPRDADPMLGGFFDRYMDGLRSFSEGAWAREMANRTARQENDFTNQGSEDRADRGLVHSLVFKKAGYGASKNSNEALYWRVKHRSVSTFLAFRTWDHSDNIAVLTHPKAYNHCLGLWLRETPGTVLASRPIADRHWSPEFYEHEVGKPWDIHQHRRFPYGRVDLDALARARLVDPVHVSWSRWSSLLGVKRMVLNLPVGWLDTPGLAVELSKRCRVIALLTHPCAYAHNKLNDGDDPASEAGLKEVEVRMGEDATLRSLTGDRPSKWMRWVVRWCMDVETLMEAQKRGAPVFFVLHEWLEWDTLRAMERLCRILSLPYPDRLEDCFTDFCVPRKGMRPIPERLKSEYGWSDMLDESEHRAVDRILERFGIDFYDSMDILPRTHLLPTPSAGDGGRRDS